MSFKILTIIAIMMMTITSFTTKTFASECGLSCCIATGIDGVGSNTGLSVSLQFDTMLMQTNKRGTTTISPNQIISENLATRPAMSMFAASKKMVMQKVAANFSYRLDEDNAFVFTAPYIINDMDITMGMKTMAGISYSDSSMPTVQGLGDVSLLYLHDIYKDNFLRTRKRLSIGLGLKAPTGVADARNSQGDLMHMLMQTGTNTWDGLFTIKGTLGLGEHDDGGALWVFSPSLFYQVNSRNNLGYKMGNRLNYDVSTRYRLTSKFNLKLDVNGVKSQHDSTDGSIDAASGKVAYQNVAGTTFNNVANTGIHSIFISPGFQWLWGDGYNISGEYRTPIYQKTNGIQQVTDHWFFLRMSKSF